MSGTDLVLLEQWVRVRNAEAFHELVRRHADMVYRTARRMLGDAIEAEDVTQECFEQLLQAQRHPQFSLGAWLHRVAVNRCLSRLRRQKVRDERAPESPESEDLRARSEREELHRIVDEVLSELPDTLRAPVVAHFLQQRTHEEIAEELGVDRSTVSRRIQKGVDTLREQLGLRGVLVPVAALAALFAQDAAMAAPAALRESLGRLALSGGNSVVRRTAVQQVVHQFGRWGAAAALASAMLVSVSTFMAIQSSPEVELPVVAATSSTETGSLSPSSTSIAVKPTNSSEKMDLSDEAKMATLSSQPPQILGRAINAVTLEPLVGIQIIAVSPKNEYSSRPFVSGTTGVDGTFALHGLAPGEYRIKFDDEGFVKKQVNGKTVLSPEEKLKHFRTFRDKSTADVNLEESSSSVQVELAVDLGVPIKGTVRGMNGEPVPGVEVRAVVDNIANGNGKTDALGRFEFRLPSSSGIAQIAARDDTRFSPVIQTALIPDTGLENLEVALDITGNCSISGIVQNEQGQPAEEISIELDSSSARWTSLRSFHTKSGKNGVFSISGLPPDEYVVQTMVQRGTSLFTGSQFPNLRLADGEQLKGVVLVHNPHIIGHVPEEPGKTSLAGRVLSKSGAVVAGIQVFCRRASDDTERYWNTTSGGSGAFKFTNLPEGEYALAAARNLLKLNDGEAVIASSGDTTISLEFEPPAPVLLRGVVKDAASGLPLPEFQLAQMNTGNATSAGRLKSRAQPHHSEEGTFEIANAYPDRVFLVAFADGYSPASRLLKLSDYQGEVLEFALEMGKQLSGRVSTSEGNAVPGALIYLDRLPVHGMPRNQNSAVSDINGEFALDDVSTEQRFVAAWHPEFGSGVEYIEDGRAEVVLLPDATLSVKVLQEGLPVPDCGVSISYADLAFEGVGVRTNATGLVKPPRMPASKCSVNATISTAHELYWSGSLPPGEELVLELEAGRPAASVSGCLKIEGIPEPGARVWLSSNRGEYFERFQTVTRDDGIFAFAGVPEGEATVTLTAGSGESRIADHRTIVVRAEEDQDLKFDLEKFGKIAVKTPAVQKPRKVLLVLYKGDRSGLMPPGQYREGENGFLSMSSPDENDKALFEFVSSGTCTVMAIMFPRDWDPRPLAYDTAVVEVREGETTEVTLSF